MDFRKVPVCSEPILIKKARFTDGSTILVSKLSGISLTPRDSKVDSRTMLYIYRQNAFIFDVVETCQLFLPQIGHSNMQHLERIALKVVSGSTSLSRASSSTRPPFQCQHRRWIWRLKAMIKTSKSNTQRCS